MAEDEFNYTESGDDWYEGQLFNVEVSDGKLKLKPSGEIIHGIKAGIIESDIEIFINQWDGSSNDGEIDLTGTYFVEAFNSETINIGAINNGVATQDSVNDVVGYLMFSEESVHTRFSPAPHTSNADHIIAVWYDETNEVWKYDNNDGFYEFTPVDTDYIIANLEWGITSCELFYVERSGSKGYRESPEIDLLSIVTAETSSISWDSVISSGTSLSIETNLSLDNGNTWYGWVECTNSGIIPEISDKDLSNSILKCRQIFYTDNDNDDSELSSLYINIVNEGEEGFFIEGYVYYYGFPASRGLNIHRRSDGKFISNTKSRASDGYYSFKVLSNESYYLIGLPKSDTALDNKILGDVYPKLY